MEFVTSSFDRIVKAQKEEANAAENQRLLDVQRREYEEEVRILKVL